MLSSQFVPYGVSHQLLDLSSGGLLTPAQPGIPEKTHARASTDSNTTGSETEKCDHTLLQRICPAPSGAKEQKSYSQTAQPFANHDLNRQVSHDAASWAKRLCHTNFFSPCARHSSKVYRRCEVCVHAYTMVSMHLHDAAAALVRQLHRQHKLDSDILQACSEIDLLCSALISAWTAKTLAHSAAAAWLTTATATRFRCEFPHPCVVK